MTAVSKTGEGAVKRGNRRRFILPVIALALFACLNIGAAEAHAGDIGSITVDGSTRNYSSFGSLASALKDYEDKTVTLAREKGRPDHRQERL